MIKDLSKSYDGRAVLSGFSAVLPAGEISGLMAPSGGGKTTLLRLLLGLERADGGSIDGLDSLRLSAVFQEDRLIEELSAEANIRLVNPKLTRADTQKALEELGLGAACGRHARELSGGMRRRVAILRALLAEYDFLALDEPFKGLDAETKAGVMAYTRKRCKGRTVLLVTHDESELDAMGVKNRLRL